MAKRRYMVCGAPTEDTIQECLIERVRADPKIRDVVFHIPNGGNRDAREGAKLKRMGVYAGVSDIFIMRARHGYHGAFIELKTKGGVLSEKQKFFLDIADREGYFNTVTYTANEAFDALEWYLFAKEGDSYSL